MLLFDTYEERFNYLKLADRVGRKHDDNRDIKQRFYQYDPKWAQVRDDVIIRDNACDLALSERDIHGIIFVHHIIPITAAMIIDGDPLIFNKEFLVTCSKLTHDGIHYGSDLFMAGIPTERKPGDTDLW